MLLLPALLATLGPAAPLADWYVDQSSPSCAAGNGSAAAPFCTIAEAITAAVDGDTIYIAAGTYSEHLRIDEDLQLIGMAGQAATVIDGGDTGRVLSIAWDAVVMLDGLTIRRGFAPTGGGIYCEGALTLRNSMVTQNRAFGQPGLFGGHFAYGGGIALFDAGVTTLDNCTISDNEVSAFSQGYAAAVGGAIYSNCSVSLELANCVLSRNRAYAASINSSCFTSGCAIRCDDSGVAIDRCTVANNLCDPSSDSIVLQYSTFTEIRNSTIKGSSGWGSPGWALSTSVAHGAASPIVEQSTIAGNVGGWRHDQSAGGAPGELRNTVIAGNSGMDVSGTFVSLGHNLIGDATGSAGFTNGLNGDLVGVLGAPIDPLLAPLAQNGGPTMTRALLPGSPAIDAGDPLVFELTDQRGYARVGLADIGAYELGSVGGAPISGCVSSPNSTGVTGVMSAAGSTSITDNALTLSASSLPASALAIFLTSRTLGFVAQPGGSAGNLCLGSGVGRFVGPGQILSTGATGTIQLAIDVNRHPTPAGLVPVSVGETWYYQAWHRDSNAGSATSNFTAGTQVTFRQ